MGKKTGGGSKNPPSGKKAPPAAKTTIPKSPNPGRTEKFSRPRTGDR